MIRAVVVHQASSTEKRGDSADVSARSVESKRLFLAVDPDDQAFARLGELVQDIPWQRKDHRTHVVAADSGGVCLRERLIVRASRMPRFGGGAGEGRIQLDLSEQAVWIEDRSELDAQGVPDTKLDESVAVDQDDGAGRVLLQEVQCRFCEPTCGDEDPLLGGGPVCREEPAQPGWSPTSRVCSAWPGCGM